MKIGGVFALFLEITLVSTQNNAETDLIRPLNGIFQYKQLTSREIFLWDSETVLITQLLYYNEKMTNREKLCFIGIDPATPKDLFVHLQFDNGNTACINEMVYRGRQIILKTPSTFYFTDFQSIGIINDTSNIVSQVLIDQNAVYFTNKTNYLGQFLAYPKCCPLDEYNEENSCKKMSEEQRTKVENIQIYTLHETENSSKMKYDNNENFTYARIPFYSPSSENLYSLDRDEYILTNTLELFVDNYIWGPIECIDYTYNEISTTLQETVFMKLRDNKSVSLNPVTPILLVLFILILHGSISIKVQ